MNKNDVRAFIQQKTQDLFHNVRPFTYALSNKKKLTGVEIGTHNGTNAKNMCKILDMKKLYIVDPYTPFKQGKVQLDFSELQKTTERSLTSAFPDVEFVFIKKYSEEGYKDILEKVDFIYVDGNHDYEFVKKDIELYYSKVKIGGIFGGHDFFGDCPGVCRAVVEFTNENKLDLHTKWHDWWIVKK